MIVTKHNIINQHMRKYLRRLSVTIKLYTEAYIPNIEQLFTFQPLISC